MIKRGSDVAAATMATDKVVWVRHPALLDNQHHHFGRLEAKLADHAVARNIFVQVSCGSMMPVEVPGGMTEAQVLAQFRKGQLIAALTALLIGVPFLLVLTFMG